MTIQFTAEELEQKHKENESENALITLLVHFKNDPESFHRICFTGHLAQDTFRAMSQKLVEMANLPGVSA